MSRYFQVMGLIVSVIFIGLLWDQTGPRGVFIFAAGYWTGRLVSELGESSE